jgi:hypothetical protein
MNRLIESLVKFHKESYEITEAKALKQISEAVGRVSPEKFETTSSIEDVDSGLLDL